MSAIGQPEPLQDLGSFTEAELLGLAAKSGVLGSRDAWDALYLRHRRYFFAVVSRTYGRFLPRDDVTDLVVDTFTKAFEWASKQNDPAQLTRRFSADTADGTRRIVLAWLATIAERQFRDRFRAAATEADDFRTFGEQWVSAQVHPASRLAPQAVIALREALSMLQPDDAEALRVSLPWYDLHTRSFNFPKNEAGRVAKLLGISADALRQRRYRALQRIKALMLKAGFVERDKEETQ